MDQSHFELVDKIRSENGSVEEYEFNLQTPFFNLVDGQMSLTDTGLDYIEAVNGLIKAEAKQADYKKLLNKFINVSKLNQNARATENIH